VKIWALVTNCNYEIYTIKSDDINIIHHQIGNLIFSDVNSCADLAFMPTLGHNTIRDIQILREGAAAAFKAYIGPAVAFTTLFPVQMGAALVV